MRVSKSVYSSLIGAALSVAMLSPVNSAEFDKKIPMFSKGAATFYVEGFIEGVGKIDFMVDTGSGYMTINESSLELLKEKSSVIYVKDLSGILADGSKRVVPIYQIGALEIGGCQFQNIEAAVFPGKTRYILGLSALKKASPFVFSLDPPNLTLSHCQTSASS